MWCSDPEGTFVLWEKHLSVPSHQSGPQHHVTFATPLLSISQNHSTMPLTDDTKRQAARETIDILYEISTLLVGCCECCKCRVPILTLLRLEYPSRPSFTLALCFTHRKWSQSWGSCCRLTLLRMYYSLARHDFLADSHTGCHSWPSSSEWKERSTRTCYREFIKLRCPCSEINIQASITRAGLRSVRRCYWLSWDTHMMFILVLCVSWYSLDHPTFFKIPAFSVPGSVPMRRLLGKTLNAMLQRVDSTRIGQNLLGSINSCLFSYDESQCIMERSAKTTPWWVCRSFATFLRRL